MISTSLAFFFASFSDEKGFKDVYVPGGESNLATWQSTNKYNAQGFLYRVDNKTDGTYTLYDASGRQYAQYKSTNEYAGGFLFNINGFIQWAYTAQQQDPATP